MALMRPGLVEGRLSDDARALMRSVALAVLDGSLPAAEGGREAALASHLERVQGTIDGFPSAMRSELSQLLGLLCTGAGRITLAGLRTDWPQASIAQVQSALQAMNLSSLALRQQAFHALRDLTNGAFYADPSTWPLIGYPGPRSIG